MEFFGRSSFHEKAKPPADNMDVPQITKENVNGPPSKYKECLEIRIICKSDDKRDNQTFLNNDQEKVDFTYTAKLEKTIRK